jgi:sugar (pentulose or hexulose) kinase
VSCRSTMAQVGGASNTGGAVLRAHFSDAQLRELSARIQLPPIGGGGGCGGGDYGYYPLLRPGERFPVNDPNLAPCMEPRPGDDAEFLRGECWIRGMAEDVAGDTSPESSLSLSYIVPDARMHSVACRDGHLWCTASGLPVSCVARGARVVVLNKGGSISSSSLAAGLLEGMSAIEARGYRLLVELGAEPGVRRVLTAGGGAINTVWATMRSRAIGVPVEASHHGAS